MSEQQQAKRPAGWGGDSLSEFISLVQGNCLGTFSHFKQEYARLTGLDKLFFKFLENLHQTESPTNFFLLGRAHGSFRASCVLTLGCQIYDAYATMRACLESALYAFFMHQHPEHQRTWIDRRQSPEATRLVRNTFVIKTMLTELAAMDSKLGDVVSELYEKTIEYGAHPNVDGVLISSEIQQTDDKVVISAEYTTSNERKISATVRDCSRLAACALHLGWKIFPQRFSILQLDSELKRLTDIAPPI